MRAAGTAESPAFTPQLAPLAGGAGRARPRQGAAGVDAGPAHVGGLLTGGDQPPVRRDVGRGACLPEGLRVRGGRSPRCSAVRYGLLPARRGGMASSPLGGEVL